MIIKFFSPSALEPFLLLLGFASLTSAATGGGGGGGPWGPGSAPWGQDEEPAVCGPGPCPAAPGLRRLEEPRRGRSLGAPLGGSWEAARAPRRSGTRGAAHPVGGLRGPDSHLPGQSRCAAPAATGADRTGSPLPSAGAAQPGGRVAGSDAGAPWGRGQPSQASGQSRLSGSGGAWDREGKGAGKAMWPCGEGRCPREPSANRPGCPHPPEFTRLTPGASLPQTVKNTLQ